MTYSLLVWEDASNIPLSPEVKETLKNIQWTDHAWYVRGLPLPFAKYSLSGGKSLYLDEHPANVPNVRKEDFTGEIAVVSYFVNSDPKGRNYLIGLIVTLVKGEVFEVQLETCKPQENEEFSADMQKMQANVTKHVKKYQTWWFRWLYKPWFYLVREPSMVAVFILNCLIWVITKVAMKLTPW